MSGSKFTYLLVCLLFNPLSAVDVRDEPYTPVVIWHGLGNSCCDSIGAFRDQLEILLPGAYVISLKIGNTTDNEVGNSVFMHPDQQIKTVCSMLSEDPLLANGFNAIGFSQGSIFFRGLIQRCPTINVKNLIALGGAHQGIFGLPHCLDLLPTETCEEIRRNLNDVAYLSWLQEVLVPATYWHNPLNESEYQQHSSYIADINNEVTINEEYKERFQTVEKFVMVKYEEEAIVVPVESSWFGFYKPGQTEELLSLKESPLYLEDRLGLKAMDDNSKLFFLSSPGAHATIHWEWFEPNVLEPFLKN